MIYARQSLDRDGSGAAVERQLAECRALATKHGLTVEREYVDNDVSASSGVRPEFSRLLDAIRHGTVSTIIVWHTDRLYRRVRDLVDIVELAEKLTLKVLTVRAGDLDLSTPAGRMLAGMLGHAARYEVEQKGARQVAANIQRAKRGHWHFTIRPYGYQRVDGRIELIPEEAAVLREAYRRFIAGESYYAIAEDFNSRGIPSARDKEWSITILRERLRNPHYAGHATYKSEITAQGDWEPVIDQDTWERFNAARSRRRVRHGWSNKTKYLLSGLAVCGVCGGRMLARPDYRGKGENKRRVMTYQCTTNWCTSRLMDPVDEVVEAAVIDRLSQPDALQLLAPPVDVAPLVEQSQELRARRDDLAGLLADGLLSAAAVKEQSLKIGKQLEQLQAGIAQAEGGSSLSALILADDIARHWHDVMTFRQKRAILTAGLTVTINKQSSRIFDPSTITVKWKG